MGNIINTHIKTISVHFAAAVFLVFPNADVLTQIPIQPLAPTDTFSPLEKHMTGPGFGFVRRDNTILNFSSMAGIRYFNQPAIEKEYVFGNGDTMQPDKRNDLSFQNVMHSFKTSPVNPDFRCAIRQSQAQTVLYFS